MTVAEAPKKPGSSPVPLPLSVKAFQALGEMGLLPKDTELLYGQVYQRLAKSPYHTYLQQVLADGLRAALPTGYYLRTDQPITCPDSEPEPDLAVVRGRKEDHRLEHPHAAEFIIEVCVTSHEYDRLKLRAYAKAGVKELWLILAPEKQIEVFREPAGGRFVQHAIHGPGGRVQTVAAPKFAVDLKTLFAK